MKKTPLIVLLVVVIAVLIAAGILQGKYEAIISAPYVSHESVAGAHTSARIVIKPLLAEDYIARRLLVPQGVPSWVADRVLPREAVLLCDTNIETGDTLLTLFLNEQRLGPVIQEKVNETGFQRRIPDITWSPEGLVRNGRGSMTLDGAIRLPPAALDTVHNQWGIVQPMKPLEIEGEHFVEAVLDNRDGAAFALLCGLYLKGGGVPPNQFNILDPNVVKGVKNIACLRLAVDIKSDTELGVGVRVECGPAASEDAVQSIKFLLDQARAAARTALKQDFGADLSGGFNREALAVVGQFTISPFEPILKWLGVPLAPPAKAA